MPVFLLCQYLQRKASPIFCKYTDALLQWLQSSQKACETRFRALFDFSLYLWQKYHFYRLNRKNRQVYLRLSDHHKTEGKHIPSGECSFAQEAVLLDRVPRQCASALLWEPEWVRNTVLSRLSLQRFGLKHLFQCCQNQPRLRACFTVYMRASHNAYWWNKGLDQCGQHSYSVSDACQETAGLTSSRVKDRRPVTNWSSAIIRSLLERTIQVDLYLGSVRNKFDGLDQFI